MNILLLGAPGAGKGTQAALISGKLGIPIISMGDMLRDILVEDESLKEQVEPYMRSGRLVPDDIVGVILRRRIEKPDCKGGFILDGYPRNVEQAKHLDKIGVNIDKVIGIHVNKEELVSRLVGRRICKSCAAPFHVSFKKPVKEGVCDFCGGELISRKDDVADVINTRLEVYYEQTRPLEGYYYNLGKFFVVNGEDSVDSVNNMLMNVVEGIAQ